MYGDDERMTEARALSDQGYAREKQERMEQLQRTNEDPLNKMPLTSNSRKLPRPIFSKAMLITLPLAVIVLFLPPNSKSVSIPVGVHEFAAVVVASLGSPLLRRVAIVVIALVIVILIVGSVIK